MLYEHIKIKKSCIGDIPFDVLTMEDAKSRMAFHVRMGEQCVQVVVANVYSVVLASKDDEFRNICQKAEFVLADGFPVVFFSKFLGVKLPQRIAGPDFMLKFSEECLNNGFKIYLLGSEEPHLSNLQKNLEKRFPGIKIVGRYSPPFGTWSSEENKKIINLINKSHADVLWVGISTPKQDKWINYVKAKLKTKIAIAVGAAFDFHSGRVKRAPLYMQQSGLEWFYRFLQEPRRLWKRYLIGNVEFFSIVIKQVLQKLLKKET